jgi:hypothetical protein
MRLNNNRKGDAVENHLETNAKGGPDGNLRHDFGTEGCRRVMGVMFLPPCLQLENPLDPQTPLDSTGWDCTGAVLDAIEKRRKIHVSAIL